MEINDNYHSIADDIAQQVRMLDDLPSRTGAIPMFKDKLISEGINQFKPAGIDVLQINLGKLCNQTCNHCHVNAGPKRTELMSREMLEHCLHVLKNHNISTVDLTGGAPEMNTNFRWFVQECRQLNKRVIVRCNLTVVLSDPKYRDLPQFFANNQVEVVSSLPFYNAQRTDSMRGYGTFDISIKVLKMLNAVGYGTDSDGLTLHLVYNPAGAFLPGSQKTLEGQFKRELKSKYDISFNNLYTITNMPVSRFLDYLLKTDNYVSYVESLVSAFNPAAVMGVMCLSMISVSWDGYLYDCDFNQMLDLKVNKGEKAHISQFDFDYLLKREVRVSQHCYGCTAGAGSSCGGATS